MLLTLFPIALQRLSISTADALAIETAPTNLPGIDPPLLLPPHLDPTLLVNNNNNPPLEVDNDFNDDDHEGGVEKDDDAIHGGEEADDDVGAAVATTDTVAVAPGAGEEAESHPVEMPIVNAYEGPKLRGNRSWKYSNTDERPKLSGNRSWKYSFELLCAFKEANGHCNVPRGYPKLGRWVNNVSERLTIAVHHGLSHLIISPSLSLSVATHGKVKV